jgi:signal transduction histidine kinase/CheY-like chemotaxis protein
LSLRLRILAVALMPLLLAVGLFAAYFTQRSVNEVELSLERQGQDSASHLANAIAFDLFSGNLSPVKRLLDYEITFRRIEAAAVTDGTTWSLISGSSTMLPLLTGTAPPQRWQKGSLLFFAQTVRLPPPNESDPYLDLPDAGRPTQYLVVSLSRAPIEVTRSQVGLAAVVTALITILFALLLAWRLSGRLSRPLLDITKRVANLAAGNLTERALETSYGEIGLLERGVNRMAQSLEENQRNLKLRVEDATFELRGQKLAAEAAVLAKSRFLAAASHDLRQPLHALTLLVAALRELVPTGEAGRLTRHIEASASAMETLLNALLDLSKLDAGVVEARPICFPVSKVFTQVASHFLPVAHSRNIRLAFTKTSLWAYSDPLLIERILANLVSNALRYTDRGHVLVSARRVGEDQIRFEVWDNGKGIPHEFQARIFEEYFQLENPERHRDKGLGLGLAIVTRLAHLLGSHVQVRSEPGQGSCFSFQLMRCKAAPEQPEAIAQSPVFELPLENALVAFIDDDEAILAAMVEVFDHWNVALAAGEDAEQVRSELQALGRVPDLILCDYRLRDGRTGVEAVQLLRDAFGANIPAALLTGDTATNTIQAIQASHLPVLHKPLKPAKLRAFLSHLLTTNRSDT